jgi:hypothetical protein
MKLFEHPEFEQLILAAESHFNLKGLTAAAIEKDYFVTEALWIRRSINSVVISAN